MDGQTLQDISHQLQLIFAGIFLFQAFSVYRVSRLELSIPYTGIVPMLLAASAHYFFWAGYWKVHSVHDVRVVGHLVWLSAALMVFFHVQALEAFLRPCPRWINRMKKLLFALVLPVFVSLLTVVFFDKTFFFSSTPMTSTPFAFPAEIQDRIREAFSMGAIAKACGLLTIVAEVLCLVYFLRRLLKTKGDRWLAFGLMLSLASIVNDALAAIRPQNFAISILFIAVFVEIYRLIILIERANFDRLLRVEHSMRLSQIGEMAAIVTHELATPLTIIQGHAEVGLRSQDLKAMSSFKKILVATERMTSMIRGLQDHSRTEENEPEILDIAEILVDLVELLLPIHTREGIELCLNVGPDLPSLKGNRGRLQQILLNLIKNARDATEGQQSRQITISASHEESHIRIEISDNGSGIPPEILDKIFTPFFTTKPRGSGTGIGLSFVESQIRLMRGKIEVRSKPGDTVFELSFPF